MKQTKLILAAALAVAFAAPAVADESYVGVAFGQSKVSLGDTAASIRAEMVAFGETGTVTTDEKGTGFKVYGGYNLNKNFAVELGYVDLGDASLVIDITAPAAANVKVKYQASGFFLDAVGKLPMTDSFALLGKVGVVASSIKATYSGDVTGSDKESETNVKFGLGAQYNATKNIGIRAEFERYKSLGKEETTGEGDVDLLSLGIAYKF